MSGDAGSSLRLSDVIRALRGAVGGWSVLGWLSVALGLLLHRRLGEIDRRMAGLLARFRAGRLWRPAARAGRVPAAREAQAGRDARIWPGRFGWLVRAASWQAAGYGAQLRAVLAQPEMVDLLAAAPQARRVLRPLCRMLAVETSVLQPLGEPGAGSPAAETSPAAAKRVRPPRPKPDWGRVPLPRGVLAAARRQGFSKG